jgi:hypothetical protein
MCGGASGPLNGGIANVLQSECNSLAHRTSACEAAILALQDVVVCQGDNVVSAIDYAGDAAFYVTSPWLSNGQLLKADFLGDLNDCCY